MGPKIKKILITTDGSDNVKNAVDWGIGLGKANGATVSALYVVPPTGFLHSMRGDMWVKEYISYLKKEGKKATEYVVDIGHNEGLKVETIIVEDKNPGDAIIDFATENDIDLIVMGTQGKTGLDHILLGSVAENVVRYAKRPVLVIP
jgi:nucleotide-binding universal stress UspA family protein